MLRYLGCGERRFGRFPMQSIVRKNWEFFAVTEGRCAPVPTPDAAVPELCERTLWVFPPGSAHVWTSTKRGVAQVAVLHFGSVPALLAAAVREHGSPPLALRPDECRRVGELAQQLQADFQEPNNFSNLVFQGALIELTLLALRKLPQRETPLPQSYGKQLVEAATSWFADNVRSNPTLEEISRRVHVSPSTLRRAFRHDVRERPVQVFARIQVETAMRLMTETTLKLDTIAGECGYSSASDFCRAFKAHTKTTPHAWRRTILTPPRAAVKPAAAS